ncbi:MAG: hypothetical protein HC836_43060 [Richelia sp. RM2_1_2]|nr:hypothetical protein [Richelia sp. RM2_1_2]
MSPNERLRDWKIFRESLIASLSDIEILQRVANYWTTVPMVKYYLDFDNPKSWPTPWELIHFGEFCPASVAYLMFKTLELAPAKRWQNNEIKIIRIKDLEMEDFHMLLVVDSQHVLNYFYGQVVELITLHQSYEIICEYSCDTLLS